jgi:hypothetical protein
VLGFNDQQRPIAFVFLSLTHIYRFLAVLTCYHISQFGNKKEVNLRRALFHAHPHHTALTLAPREQGVSERERRVSAERLASRVSRARSSSFDGPKWAPFLTLFWASSCTTASSRPGRSDRRIPEERGSTFSHAHKMTTARLFRLLPPPLST